jgi:hypothetical protein
MPASGRRSARTHPARLLEFYRRRFHNAPANPVWALLAFRTFFASGAADAPEWLSAYLEHSLTKLHVRAGALDWQRHVLTAFGFTPSRRGANPFRAMQTEVDRYAMAAGVWLRLTTGVKRRVVRRGEAQSLTAKRFGVRPGIVRLAWARYQREVRTDDVRWLRQFVAETAADRRQRERDRKNVKKFD